MQHFPADTKRDWIAHTVKKGETLGGIAARYGISAKALQETNRLKSTKRLSVGSTIVVPVPRGSSKHTLQFSASSMADDSPPVRTRISNGRSKLERALAQCAAPDGGCSPGQEEAHLYRQAWRHDRAHC